MQTQYGKWFKKEMSIEIGHKWVILSVGCYNPVGVKKMITKLPSFFGEWKCKAPSHVYFLIIAFFKY